jgi:type VI secretion system protein ImpE
VLTTTGKYYWIPTERLISVELHAPKRPRDLLWRRASMSVDQGPDGDVYIPVVYAGDDTMSELQRLGRETDWQQAEGGPVRGLGQRVFLVGEEDVAIMELGKLSFTGTGGA